MRKLLLALFVITGLSSANAQEATTESETEENGFILNLVQETLSSDTRKIQFSGVSGALSSNATIERITIADAQGIWLEINEAELKWTRSALLLGRLNIEEISAQSVVVSRKPIAGESTPDELPDPAESTFRLPDLPVSVQIDKASIPSIRIGAPVFGTEVELDFDASMTLADGSLNSDLVVNRLGASQGKLELHADFANETDQLDVDIVVQEPPDGVIAELLNIADRPALSLEVKGSGPLSDFDAELQLDVDGQVMVAGEVGIQNVEDGRGFSGTISGDLQPLIPAAYRGFFAGSSLVSARGVLPGSGGVRLDALQVESAGLDLSGDALISPDGFPKSANLKGQIGSSQGDVTLLPVAGGTTTLQMADIDVQLGDTGAWTGAIRLNQLDTGDLLLDTARLTFNGTVANVDMPGQRSLSASLDGAVEGIEADDPEIDSAIGERIDLAASFDWTEGQPFVINQTDISGEGVAVSLQGEVRDLAFFGDLSVELADLAPFSGLAGRALAGRIDFATSGTVRPLTGGFDLELTGTADELGIGDPQLDPLLAGRTVLSGGISRDRNGFRTDRFQLSNPQVEIKADGGLSLERTDLTIGANLTDIGLATDQASGPVQLIAEAKGDDTGPIALEAVLTLPDTRLRDHRLQAGRVAITGDLQRNRDIAGRVSASTIFDGLQTSLTGNFEVTKTLKALRDFNFVTEGAAVSGALEQDANGMFTGDLDLRAPDISNAAALALQDASGSVFAMVSLRASQGQQNIQTNAQISQLSVAGMRIGEGDIEATIVDILGIPLADGEVHLQDVVVSGQGISQLDATATRNGETMDLQAEADLLNGTHAELAGSLAQLNPGLRLTLQDLLLQQGEVEAKLNGQSVLEIIGDAISLTPLVMDIDDGSLSISGEVSETLALDFDAKAIPLSIANTISADFGVGGTLDGVATVSGDRSNPQIDFQTTLSDFTAAPLANAGVPPLSLTAQGDTDTSVMNLNAALTSANGIDARAAGAIPLSADAGDLDVNVDLKSLPLVLLNAVAPGQGITGNVTGTADITGPIDAVEATFNLSGQSLGATALRQNGISVLQASAAGQFANQTVTLQNAQITGPQGLRLTADGRVPLSGPGLGLSINGLVPLSLANTALAAQSAQVSGDIRLAANVTGSLAQPDFNGSANMSGGVFVMPLLNLRMQDISLAARLSQQQIVLDELKGRFAAGGNASASGTISLDVTQGMPVDLNTRLRRAVYSDGSVVTTKISSDIDITGPLLNVPLIAGEVNIVETDIVLPERFSISQGALLDVQHVNPPRDVRMTLDRAGIGKAAEPSQASSGFDARLDVQINAVDRIFVRGWGLDAELGGDLRLRGLLSAVNPIGAFNLIRGRIAIAGTRLDFSEGRLSFAGSLNPEVYFRTETQAGDYTVYLTISGALPEPDVVFSASPDLPEDEALAQLLFSTPINELSAFQIAQLASAVAFLTGGGRPGLVDGIRSGLRLDNLDFTTDEQGETAVSAGKYIDDNIYLDLEAQADGGTAATITLDITDELKARGSLESEGNSSLGIFFERDY